MAKEPDKKPDEKPVCGIIMPISAMPPIYDAAHWKDVRTVFDTAIVDAGFFPQIVSDSFESDVIQNRIIQNLYSNDVVICDVSGLNANVMFELGVRITFNKPVIVVTDDVGSIPFDTRIIEHLPYPRDLHIHQTQKFISDLATKIKRISDAFKGGKFKTPLDALGSFEVFKPTTHEVSGEKYIVDGIDAIMRRLSRLEGDIRQDKTKLSAPDLSYRRRSSRTLIRVKTKLSVSEDISDAIISGIKNVQGVGVSEDGRELTIYIDSPTLTQTANATRALEMILGPVEVISLEVE